MKEVYDDFIEKIIFSPEFAKVEMLKSSVARNVAKKIFNKFMRWHSTLDNEYPDEEINGDPVFIIAAVNEGLVGECKAFYDKEEHCFRMKNSKAKIDVIKWRYDF